MIARRILLALFALTPPALAGALDPRNVPAGAAWVLHVDFEVLSRSALLSALHESGQHVENDLDLDQVQRDFGLDPDFVDLRSLTMYGSGRGGADVVTVVAGTDRLDRAWEKLATKAKAVRIAGRDVRVLKERHFTLRPARAGEARTAVVATSAQALESALLLLDREAPSLADAPTPGGGAPRIIARPTTGSLVFAASSLGSSVSDNSVFYQRALQLFDELAGLSDEGELDFVLSTRGFDFDLSEVRGEVSIRSSFETKTAAEADKLEAHLRASIAAVSMNDSSDAARRMRALLGALRLESPATKLLVSYRYGAGAFVADVLFVEKARAAAQSR